MHLVVNDVADENVKVGRNHERVAGLGSMVPLAGLEPAQAAYLALTGYKSAALPIELQGLISD